MADLIQNNLALEERLDKQGTRLYNLENLNIAHNVSQAVDEIVTDAVDWAMQALLRVRFRGLPTVDMKKILQQRMFKDDSYKLITRSLYETCIEALQKSLSVRIIQNANPTTSTSSSQAVCDAPDTLQEHQMSLLVAPPPPPPPSTDMSQLVYFGPTSYLLMTHFSDALEIPYPDRAGHVTIQPQFFFNKDLEYLRYGSKGSNPALSISKIKAASYPDFGLELLVPEQMWIDDVYTYVISAKYGISHWWFNRQKFYIDRHDSSSHRKDVRTHMRILSHLDHLPGSDKQMLSTTVKLWTRNLVIRQRSPRAVVFPVDKIDRKIMRFNEIYKFSDGTLTRILEALDYRVKEFKVKWLNPGLHNDGDAIPSYRHIQFNSHMPHTPDSMTYKTIKKNDPKLPQTLISTSSSICQSDEVMN
ncbi:hypothetical protein Tco_0008223 [Tanacetum coccineum]